MPIIVGALTNYFSVIAFDNVPTINNNNVAVVQ